MALTMTIQGHLTPHTHTALAALIILHPSSLGWGRGAGLVTTTTYGYLAARIMDGSWDEWLVGWCVSVLSVPPVCDVSK